MNRTEKYPIGASITPEQLEGDLHPLMHQLREHEPVSWLPALNTWLVTRRDLCIEVMRDAKLYTVDHPGFSTGQVVGPSMLSLDGANQKRHRDPFEYPFRKREVEQRFSESVAACIAGLIDGFVDSGSAELRRVYAGPIAVHAMIAALGLEATPVKQVLDWYDTIVDAVTRVSLGEAVSAEGQAAFDALRESLLPSMQNTRQDSLLATALSLIHI